MSNVKTDMRARVATARTAKQQSVDHRDLLRARVPDNLYLSNRRQFLGRGSTKHFSMKNVLLNEKGGGVQ